MLIVDSNPLKILVVDDNQSTREMVCSVLESAGHRTVQVHDAIGALAAYAAQRPDLVLLDVELPRRDGYWVARKIRSLESGGWTPIVFLSAHGDERALWSGIEAGGDDYLAKPVSPMVLLAKLIAMQRLMRMRQRLVQVSEELTEANAKLERQTLIDPLTGLRNRRGFESQLRLEITAARRDRRPLTLMMCDVDHFKRYNDRLGHPAGDRCLVTVAEVLSRACRRPRDGAVRYGGEEFALLLPDTPRSGAMTFARALRRLLGAAGLAHPDSPVSASVTLSGGITTCMPDDDTTPEGLVLRADEALYAAKLRGRDRFFSFEMQVDSQAPLAPGDDLPREAEAPEAAVPV